MQLTQTTSKRGREFIIREEGLIPHAYNDPVGHCTFGVGRLLHLGNCTRADYLTYGTRSFHPGGTLRAKLAFRKDLKPFEAVVRREAGRELPQHKFDALVSLAFNIGTGGFSTSTVSRRVREKAGEEAVAEAIRMWDKPSILKPRRDREARLYTTGRYS